MSSTTKIILLLAGTLFLVFAATVAFIGISYVQAYNLGNREENRILAQNDSSQAVLTTMTNSVMTMVQVPKMATENIRIIVKESMAGRYGPNGSQAAIQAIQENYPGQIDPQLYTNIQRTIEAGNTAFQIEQQKQIAIIASYKTNLNSLWTGKFLAIAGYPKIALKDYTPVVSAASAEAFETKRLNPLNLGN